LEGEKKGNRGKKSRDWEVKTSLCEKGKDRKSTDKKKFVSDSFPGQLMANREGEKNERGAPAKDPSDRESRDRKVAVRRGSEGVKKKRNQREAEVSPPLRKGPTLVTEGRKRRLANYNAAQEEGRYWGGERADMLTRQNRPGDGGKNDLAHKEKRGTGQKFIPKMFA